MVRRYAWVLAVSGVNALTILALWAGGKYPPGHVEHAFNFWLAGTVFLFMVAVAMHIRDLERRVREYEELERKALAR
jgi:hypothetical protein